MPTVTLRKTTSALFASISVVGAGALAYEVSLDAGFARIRREADDRLTLLASTLEATVERFRYLPVVLTQADPIRALYRDPQAPGVVGAANRYLQLLDRTAGSAELFVTDPDGLTLAASNHQDALSFVGQNYSFRPYFRQALRKGDGRYYAIGATTGRPGYFLSHRIADGARTLGVAVVKIDLGPLEDDLSRGGALVAIVDANGIVFLASRAAWKYRPLTGLSRRQLERLSETRQYGGKLVRAEPLFAAERGRQGLRIVRTAGESPAAADGHVVHTRPLSTHGWTLLALFPFEAIRRQALVAALAIAFCTMAMFLVGLAIWQRRQVIRAKLEAHEGLERRVAERTLELRSANLRLSTEVEERVRAERDLRLAQEKLIQAAKLASLGQALAGVAHEINQPLSALGVYIASTRVLLERAEIDRALGNLGQITAITERMAALTRHLKTFARKDTDVKSAIDLVAAVAESLPLLAWRIKDESISSEISLPQRPVYVLGNQIRVEQVVVNLVANALDAMQDQPRRILSIALHREAGSAVLEIGDTGRGIAPEHIGSLFDPFFTTKEVGDGLGLGLSISYGIIRDMEGEISVRSGTGEGTTFRITLPAIDAPEQAGGVEADR